MCKQKITKFSYLILPYIRPKKEFPINPACSLIEKTYKQSEPALICAHNLWNIVMT